MTKNAFGSPTEAAAHWSVSGNWIPVHQETTTTELPVTGVIPDFLDGRYVRTGPNPITSPDPARHSMYFGAGMVHGLRIGDGRAQWYRNRWVRSTSVSRALGERRRGGPAYGGFDFAANINVVQEAGRTIALAESGIRPYELNDTLDTVGGFDFHGTLRGGYAPLPKRDPKTGELHGVSYSPLFGSTVRYTVVGVDGYIRRSVDIKLTAMPMMHDFALTERYVVIYDVPVVLDWAAVAPGPRSRRLARQLNRVVGKRAVPGPLANFMMAASSFVDVNPRLPFPFLSDPDRPMRLGILPRTGAAADIRWFDVPRCFVYHTLNAYDRGDEIVLEVVRHSDVFTEPGGEPVSEIPTLDRWTVDLTHCVVREQRIDDRGQEFPRIDERLTGLPHRYGYCVRYTGYDPTGLLRHDMLTGVTREVSFGDRREGGEFVFVPREQNAAENDGVLMGFVYDAANDRSDLVLLDADSLDLVATVHLPVRVPHGFHGNWMPTL